ncbi:hypothetical protein LTR01_001539 [Friedmanniomyces endolithicus]|nr:hypothetical protein LTR01_001539 [Friedmanniomyces endolithicus]KAK0830961.1 hypothetical protein LTR73_003348 [Friedmanniomyces endolithicus]
MARTKAASKKRKADAQLDMIEGATSRQDVLDNRLTTQPNESDSRTNAVGRKRQRTDGVRTRELTLPDIEPKQLRHQIKVEMQKRGTTAIEALTYFTAPGRPNRTIAQKFVKTWMQGRHERVSGSETSEGTVDPGRESDFSEGEVTPINGGNGGGSDDDFEVRQARPDQEQTKLEYRARGKVGASDGPAVSNIRPKLLRKAIGREMKRTQNSLIDILAAFCEPEMPCHEIAQDLFNRWYHPVGKVASQSEPEPVAGNEQAEAGLISDRDDVSVGEVTPVIAPSIDHDPEPRSASPDDGRRRIYDLDREDREMQATYFLLTDSEAVARCLSCGEAGHLDYFCPGNTCKHCGTTDEHLSDACPTIRKCSKCRQRGHVYYDCDRRAVRGGSAGDPCDICGGTGHVEEECSGLWRTIGKVDAQRPVRKIPVEMMRKACYNCGSDSHWGDDCDSLPHFLLEKVGEGGTWSARNADQYVDYGEAGPPQQQSHGRNRGAKRSPPPQAYQLEQFDDFRGDW